MAKWDIPGVRFYRTDDMHGDHRVSAVYAIVEPKIALDGAVRAPTGYQAVMWAAGSLSEGQISTHFLARFCREIGAGTANNYAPGLLAYVRAHLERLQASA